MQTSIKGAALQCHHQYICITLSHSINPILPAFISIPTPGRSVDRSIRGEANLSKRGSIMAIMMSSGKSRSMAAALLLVAVVACTCAAGVQAQNSFNITNSCNKTIVITTATGNVTLPPGGTVQENTTASAFFVNPVTVTITVGSSNVTIRIPGIAVDFIDLQTKLGLALQSIEIKCVGDIIFIIATYQSLLFPGLPPLILPFGPFL